MPSARPVSQSAPLIRSVFFGMHDGRITQGVSPDASVGAIRLWDSGTSWRELETSPGHFDWSGLDTAVATAERAHARPLLVLGQTPSFYAAKPGQDAFYGPGAASMPDLRAWRRYAATVAKRYGDRIDYQTWNEPNVVGFWSGSPRQMAELTLIAARAIHQEAPRASVVAPPFVLRLASQRKYFRKFWSLQTDGVDLVSALDAATLNLYPTAQGSPEAVIPLVESARREFANAGVSLPLWNTEINYGLEGGRPTPAPLSLEDQRAFLMRTYLLNAGLGLRRVYWYRWDLTSLANTLLITSDLSTPTLAGRSLATVRSWLVGARVEPCSSEGSVWSCKASKNGATMTFSWKRNGPPERVRLARSARAWTDVDGRTTRCESRCQVRLTRTPILITTG